MKIKPFIFLLFIFFIELVIIIQSVSAATKENTQNGVYSIQHFPKNDLLPLDGKWEFYWNELYTPNDFKRNTIQKVPQIVEIPEGPNGYNLGRGKTSNTGYATYRLKLIFPKEEVGTIKALYLPSIASAYTLWIDGKVKASNGKVGKTIDLMKPENRQKIAFFQVQSPTVELVIQNSNFNQRKAGIFDSILIGQPDVVTYYRQKSIIFRAFLVASIAIIGLYHLALFAFRRTELSLIFFGMTCLLIALRSALLEDAIASYLLPFLSWDLASKLEYLGLTLGILFFSLFSYTQFSMDMNRKMRNILIFMNGIYSLFVLVAPVMVSTKTMVFMQAIALFTIGYLVYVFTRAFIKKRQGSFINAVAIIILFAAGLNDILMYNAIIRTVELASVGLVFFLFTQSIIISKKYSLSFKKSDRLSKDLSILNASLEEKVQDRTEELNHSNQQLQEVNHQLRETHLSKSKLMNNISHEIGSPLTIIRAYTKDMLDGAIENNPKYIELVYEKSVFLSKILEDLVSFSDITNQQIQFNLEKVKIRNFCQSFSENQILVLEKQEITFEYRDLLCKKELHPYVLMDATRMTQVLTNLINNAQRFVGENGSVTLELNQQDEENILITISDNGTGIKEDEIDKVFERFFSRNRQGKPHHGAGLGLAISKEIIDRHKGKIWVTSEPGKGTCFSFTLPIITD